MSDAKAYDPRFSLPAVDDPASTELGVILLGLDADRLLAGLGMAALSGYSHDTATVTLLVDLAMHGVPDGRPLGAAVAAGTRRWRAARPALSAGYPGGTPSAAPRQAWAQAYRVVAAAGAGKPGSATHAYLTACWLRRNEVDRRTNAEGTS